MTKHDIVIIGAGPAGLASAIAAYNAGVMDIVIIERDKEAGGILNQCIHNGFGLHRFGEELTGPEYAAKYIDMLNNTDIKLLLGTMVVSIDGKIVSMVSEADGFCQIEAKAIILAMGCRERNHRLPTPLFLGFPGGSEGKESASNVGDLGLIPGFGRSPGGVNGYPLQYSCLLADGTCLLP